MKLITAIFFLSLVQCGSHIGFYQGHVLNKTKKPIVNLKVYEKYKPSNFTYTDKDGYFKLLKNKERISQFLIIESSDKKILDSMQVIRTSGGEKINYHFVQGRSDTLKLNK